MHRRRGRVVGDATPDDAAEHGEDVPARQGRHDVASAFEPLALELARQQQFADAILAGKPFVDRRESDVSALDWAAHVMEKRTDDSRVAEAV